MGMIINPYRFAAPSAPVAFVDDFNDNSINTSLWTVDQSGGTTVAEVNNHIEVTPTANTSGYGTLTSRPVNFASGNSVEFTLVQRIAAGPGGNGYEENAFQIYKDDNNLITFNQSGAATGSFRYSSFNVRTAGVNNDSAFGTALVYSPFRGRFVLSGTSLTLQTWNGSSFVNHTTKTVSWDMSSVRFRYIAGLWGTGNPNTQKGILDDVISTATYIP